MIKTEKIRTERQREAFNVLLKHIAYLKNKKRNIPKFEYCRQCGVYEAVVEYT